MQPNQSEHIVSILTVSKGPGNIPKYTLNQHAEQNLYYGFTSELQGNKEISKPINGVDYSSLLSTLLEMKKSAMKDIPNSSLTVASGIDVLKAWHQEADQDPYLLALPPLFSAI